MSKINTAFKGGLLLAIASCAVVANAQYHQPDDFMPSPHYGGAGDVFYGAVGVHMTKLDFDVLNGRIHAPGAGAAADSFFDVFCDIALNGSMFSSQGHGRMHIQNAGGGFFDTEMLQLDLAGGTLPNGVMIRESPTRQSLGRTSMTPDASGFVVNSFFDIFTELSIDGGQTWVPGETSMRMNGSPTPEPASLAVLGLGVLVLLKRRKRS